MARVHSGRRRRRRGRPRLSLSDQQTAGAYSQLISLRDATGTGPELPLIIEIVFVCFSFCSVPATILLDDGAAAVVVLILSQHIPAALCWRGPIGLSLSLSLFLANRIKDLEGDLASLFCFYDPSERPRKCRKGSAGQKKNRKKKKRVETFQPSLPYIDAEIGPFVSLLCNSRRPGRNDCIYHLIGLNSICCLIWTRISRFSFLPYLFLCSLCVIACRVQPLRKTTTAHPV